MKEPQEIHRRNQPTNLSCSATSLQYQQLRQPKLSTPRQQQQQQSQPSVFPGVNKNGKKRSAGNHHNNERIILLLDLDCFYAQCECLRLGLDARTEPLALLQWNSVLAVTYPARRLYNIQRGYSWQQIEAASAGSCCYAVHVPVLSVTDTTTTNAMEDAAMQRSQHSSFIATPDNNSHNYTQNCPRSKQSTQRRPPSDISPKSTPDPTLVVDCKTTRTETGRLFVSSSSLGCAAAVHNPYAPKAARRRWQQQHDDHGHVDANGLTTITTTITNHHEAIPPPSQFQPYPTPFSIGPSANSVDAFVNGPLNGDQDADDDDNNNDYNILPEECNRHREENAIPNNIDEGTVAGAVGLDVDEHVDDHNNDAHTEKYELDEGSNHVDGEVDFKQQHREVEVGDDYAAHFQLTPAQQAAARQSCLGVRCYSHQGKASIERYRIASARIFQTCLSFLRDVDPSIVLERASIDEFYVDVTSHCYQYAAKAATASMAAVSQQQPEPEDYSAQMQHALRETVLVGHRGLGDDNNAEGNHHPEIIRHARLASHGAALHSAHPDQDHRTRDDDDEVAEDGWHHEDDLDAEAPGSSRIGSSTMQRAALQHACWLSYQLRGAVFSRLGFTMSAGIACNKMLAKLSASYGKPDGQAVTYPHQIRWLLDQTPIRKCRNLGGKLGAQIQALLPPDAPKTVGSIARFLSLPVLIQRLAISRGGGNVAAVNASNATGNRLGAVNTATAASSINSDATKTTATWVYQVAQGIDWEPVIAKNVWAVAKTITAFKSLPFALRGHAVADCMPWFKLLAHEVVERVTKDAAIYARYPRHCNIQYCCNLLDQIPDGPASKEENDQDSSSQHERRRARRPKFNPNNKSIRVAFPPEPLSFTDKIERLAQAVPQALVAKEGPQYRLTRIGLCAIDFITRPTDPSARLDGYFGLRGKSLIIRGNETNTTSGCCFTSGNADQGIDDRRDLHPCSTPLTPFVMTNRIASQLSESSAKPTASIYDNSSESNLATQQSRKQEIDPIVVEDGDEPSTYQPHNHVMRDSDNNCIGQFENDWKLAKELQDKYDREFRMRERLDLQQPKRQRQQLSSVCTNPAFDHVDSKPKSTKIDSFFHVVKR